MLQKTSLRAVKKAAAVVPRVPTATSLETHKVVSRLTAGRHDVVATAGAYSAIIAAQRSSVATAAAHLGRATVLLQREAAAAALEDIDAAMKSGPGPLTRHATALRLKAHNVLLDAAEHKMLVSGATNEAEVSQLRAAVQADIDALAADSPDCWLTALAKAEFSLCQGQFAEALASLEGIVPKIAARIVDARVNRPQDPAPVVVDEANVASVISYQLATCAGAAPELLSTIAKKFQLSGADEAAAVAEVLSAAQVKHLYVDFFTTDDRYHLWHSTAATKVAHSLEHLEGCSGDVDAAVANFVPAKPTAAYHADNAALTQILESKTGNVVDQLVAAFGPKGATISDADSAFAKTMHALREARETFPTRGARGVEYQSNFANTLREQLLYRAMVAKALALEQLQRGEEAVALLSEVLQKDTYIHMWKVLLARGRIYRTLGQVDLADADYKQLFALKKQHAGRDLPQVDEHRSKSAF